MRFESIVAQLFDFYVLGCFTAIAAALFSKERQREGIFQPALYLFVIALFEWRMHGKAHEYHYWWYFWNFATDLWIVVTSFGIKAYSSKYVAAFGTLACFVDLSYFLTAMLGNPLPGIGYYTLSETFESLQVLSMIVFTGFVMSLFRSAWAALGTIRKRAHKWHQHRLIHQD